MSASDDTLERIRRGYHALGLGAHRDVVAMFEDHAEPGAGALDREPGAGAPDPLAPGAGDWEVVDVVDGQRYRPRELVAMDLFGGIPQHWDLVGVDVEKWTCSPWRRLGGFGRRVEGTYCLMVSGHFRTRPRAPDCRWHVERVPFIHIWCLVGERVKSVYNYLDGIELRRLPAAA